MGVLACSCCVCLCMCLVEHVSMCAEMTERNKAGGYITGIACLHPSVEQNRLCPCDNETMRTRLCGTLAEL